MRLILYLLLGAFSICAADKHTILAVFAHPDDETTAGALLARYAALGHDVWLLAMTSGQRGFTPNTAIKDGAELGAARESELRCSAKSLGVHEPVLFQYQDQGISTPPVMEEITRRLRGVIAEKKPDVVITFGPEGVSGHPDHRVTSSMVTQVFQQRGLLEWKPKKLYYVVFSETALVKPPPPFDRRPLRTVSDPFITTEIDCRKFRDAAFQSIQCHKTQWSAEQMKQLDELMFTTFGGMAHLRLALSEIPAPAGRRETDILDGLK